MKKYYDKVLFLLALVVLGLGAGIFFKKGGVPKSPALPAAKLSGDAFTTIPAPTFDKTTYTWESPPDQREDDPGWIYYVFTPPKIWWEQGTGWIAVPPVPIVPVPFGLHLVSAKKELYRVQLQGTSGNGDKDDEINFSDEETGLDFHLKLGQESELHKIKVTDLSFDPVDKGHGVVFKAARATILDESTGETVTLTEGVEFAPTDNQVYVLQTDDPFPSQEWKVSSQDWKVAVKNGQDETLKQPGGLEDFKGDIVFKVVNLDFDKPSVTVEKQFTTKSGRKSTKTMELTITQAPAKTESSPAK